MKDLKNIIESLLFVADAPITIAAIKDVTEIADGREIRQTLLQLVEEYRSRNGAFALFEVAGGWQLRTLPPYNEWIKRFLQPSPQRLSKAALETLAIVAYKQPIIRADIEHIRGVDCGGVLRMLMERKLVKVLGRREIPGRPLIYATTKLFLELFNLKDLKDLPSPKEIEALNTADQAIEKPPGDQPSEDQAPSPADTSSGTPAPDKNAPADGSSPISAKVTHLPTMPRPPVPSTGLTDRPTSEPPTAKPDADPVPAAPAAPGGDTADPPKNT